MSRKGSNLYHVPKRCTAIKKLVLEGFTGFTVPIEWRRLHQAVIRIMSPPECICKNAGAALEERYYGGGSLYMVAPSIKDMFVCYRGYGVPQIYAGRGLVTGSRTSSHARRFTLSNERWSLSKPFGKVCPRMRSSRKDLSQLAVDPAKHTPLRWSFLGRFGTVKLQGLPDSFVMIRPVWDGLYYLHWERVAPTKPTMGLTIQCLDLINLKYFTVMRKEETNMAPSFNAPRLLELNLFALPGSDRAWKLDELLVSREGRCTLLKVINLMGQIADDSKEEYLPITSTHLGKTGSMVSYLTVIGYVPTFLLDTTSLGYYPHLKCLRVDISYYPLTTDTNGDHTASIAVLSRNFPVLTQLELEVRGGLGNLAVAKSIKINVSYTCHTLKLSSILCLIPDVFVSGKTVQMQNIAIEHGWQSFYRLDASERFKWGSTTRCVQSTTSWLMAKDVALR